MMGSASSPELTSQDLQATNSAYPAGAAHFLGAPYPPFENFVGSPHLAAQIGGRGFLTDNLGCI